jgi:hypothetical protein
MGKISKSIRLRTPLLSSPLQEGPDRKTVELTRYPCALICVPVWSPSSYRGGYPAALPFPALKGGHGERNGDFTRDKNRIVVVARRDNKTKNTLKIRRGEIP